MCDETENLPNGQGVHDVRAIYNCKECSHFYIGFLSEPSECAHPLVIGPTIPYNIKYTPITGIPCWCPLHVTKGRAWVPIEVTDE